MAITVKYWKPVGGYTLIVKIDNRWRYIAEAHYKSFFTVSKSLGWKTKRIHRSELPRYIQAFNTLREYKQLPHYKLNID